MVITLTPEIERVLDEQARRQGTTPENLVLRSLRERFLPSEGRTDSSSPSRSESLADFLQGHLGVLHSGEHLPEGARMSEKVGERFSELLVRRRAEGEG